MANWNFPLRPGKQCLLFTLSDADHALVPSDDYTQQCQANCWTGKRDGGMSPSDVSLVERAAATPVNAWAEICNINCDDGWQICVALVNGSKGKFSLKGW
jgi:hypothetical protein